MNKRLLIIGLMVIVIIGIVIFFNRNNSTGTVSKELVGETDFSDSAIKKSLDNVEKIYKEAKSKYNGYKRSTFYTVENLNKDLEDWELEFVSIYKVDGSCVYSLSNEKIDDLDMYDEDNVKTINNELVNIDNSLALEDGKTYLLRARGLFNSTNLYYLVEFSNKGVSKIDLVFYTLDEIIINENEEIEDFEE